MPPPDAPADERDSDSAVRDTAFPGHTIDALRTQGKAAEARAEFERLVQEGADSGIDPRAPAAILDAVRAEIRGRTGAQTGDATGAEG